MKKNDFRLAVLIAFLFMQGTQMMVHGQEFVGYYVNYGEYGVKPKGSTEWCVPPIYDYTASCEKKEQPIFCVKKAGRWGFIDENNNTIIPFQYLSANHFHYNVASVKDEDDELYYAINLKGEKVGGPYKSLVSFPGHFEAKDMNGMWRLLDMSLKPFSDREYQDMKYLTIEEEDGTGYRYYLVKHNGHYGLVDNVDNILIPFNYDTLVVYNYSIIDHLSWKVTNKIKPTGEQFLGVFLMSKTDPKYKISYIKNYGLVNMKGEEMIPAKESIYGFRLSVPKYWKKVLLPYMNNHKENKQWLLSRLREGKRQALQRVEGYLAALPHDYVHPVEKNLAIKKTKTGQSLQQGGKILGTYAQITKQDRNYIVKDSKGRYGLLNENGETLLGCDYSKIEVYRDMPNGGTSFKIYKDGKEGLVFADGTLALPAWYEKIDSVPDNYYYIVKDQGEYFTIKRTGTRINDYNYTSCEYDLEQKNVTVQIPFYDKPIILTKSGKDNVHDLIKKRIRERGDVQERIRFANLEMSFLEDKTSQTAKDLYLELGKAFRSTGDYDVAKQYLNEGRKLGSMECENEYNSINNAISAANAPSLSIWDVGIGLLNSVGGLLNGGKPLSETTSISSYGNTGGSYDDGGASSVSSGRDYSYYKNQYDRWANNAQSVYNSLTLTGSKTKTNGKYTSGNTNQLYSGPNYVSLKKNLRDAQYNMKRIRQEARRAGHDIPKSEYETVTVSY